MGVIIDELYEHAHRDLIRRFIVTEKSGDVLGGIYSRDGEPPIGYSNAGARSVVDLRDGTPPEIPPHPPGPVTPGWSNLVAVEAVPPGPAPVLSALNPASVVLGSPDLTLSCVGTDFTPDAVIVFNGFDEPTTVVSPTEVTTGINMAVWAAPAVLPVKVRTGNGVSNELMFEFTDAALGTLSANKRKR
jgi:hypothetical protein